MGIGFGETLPRMSEQLTDQVLVERVQKGDQKAFNLLVVRYQHKVLKHGFPLCTAGRYR